MADTVVGALRTLLTMDTASFEAGAKKATSATVSLDKSLEELGKETDRLTARGERMVKSFGGEKLLARANDLTAAVAKFGGVAKLTEAEQGRVNATVTQAIEKYRLLGLQAPKAMLELAAATKQAETPTNFLTTKMVALGAAVGTFASQLGVQAVRALVNFGRQAFTDAAGLIDLSNKTQESTDSLQRMRFVAAQTGTSFEAMTNAAFMLRTRLATGSLSVVNAFDDLKKASGDAGLSVSSSADEVLASLSKIEDGNERIRLGTILFGKSFKEVAAAVTEGYGKIADGATLATRAQLEALDRASDAWDKFKSNVSTGITSILGDTIQAIQALRQVQQERGLFASTAGIIGEAQRRVQLGLLDAKTKDIRLTADQSVTIETYVHQLAQAQTALSKLTATQRAELLAAQQLGASQEEQIALLAKWGVDISVAEGVLRLFTGTTKESAKAIKEHTEALKAQFQAFGLLVPSIKDNAASLTAYDLIVTNSVDMMGDWAAAAREAQAELQHLGMLPLPNFASPEASRQIETAIGERSERWKDFADTVKNTFESLNTAVAGSFAQMALGAKKFKDGFIDIWQSIKAAVTRIFAEIAGSFITGLLKKMAAGIAGTAVAGAVGGAAAGTAAAAGGAGAAAELGGFGASAAAFATNPFTLAIAGGIGAFFLGRKLFGGGEEMKVNPRRDQFQAQFGGGDKLAALLTAMTGKPGGGGLFAALQAADTISRFESSEKAIAGFLAGRRNVKLFDMGGFVPPGAIQPAILHGGSFGEDIVPRGTSPGAGTNISLTMNISAINAKGVREFVESRDFTDSLDRAFVHNKRFLTTRVRSSLLP